MNIPLDWWDGQPIHMRNMITEIHKVTNRRPFKFEDLLKILDDRGFMFDRMTSYVFQKTPPDGVVHSVFLDSWKPSGTVKDCVIEYHAWCAERGIPKSKLILKDLVKTLEDRGFRVDPVTFVVSQTNIPRE